MKIQKHTKLHALTISHACIYIYLLFILNETLKTDSKSFDKPEEDMEANQQVIFENNGFFVKSTSYFHVHINLPISPLLSQLNNATNMIKKLTSTWNPDDINSPATEIINSKIANQALDRIFSIRNDLYEAAASLPTNSKDTQKLLSFTDNIPGTLGTVFGSFSENQIDIIQSSMTRPNKFNNLINIENRRTTLLDLDLYQLKNLNWNFIENSSALLDSTLETIIFKASRSANIIHSAIQQAQNQKLSTTIFNSTVLKSTFDTLHIKAIIEEAKLFITHPSDLYQLESSFINFKGDSISIIVHVPMAKSSQIFNLYQHLPIPLAQSFSTNLTITPKLDQDMIAIGANNNYKTLSKIDLAQCKTLGEYFLCDGRDVVQTDLEDNCLGALFRRNIDHVLLNCQFEIGDAKERVITLGRNQYIITTPTPFEATKICENQAHSSVSINRISRIKIEEGCRIQLKRNEIQPDINHKDQPAIIYKNINWDLKLLFPTQKLTDLHDTLTLLRKQGTNIITAQELRHINVEDNTIIISDNSVHPHIIFSLSSAVIIIVVNNLIIGFIVYCYNRKINLPAILYHAVRRTKQPINPAPASIIPEANF